MPPCNMDGRVVGLSLPVSFPGQNTYLDIVVSLMYDVMALHGEDKLDPALQ